MLSENVKITKVAASVDGTGTVVTGAIDMQGFNGVLVMSTMATANAGNYVKAGQDDAVGLGTIADIEGSKVVCTASPQVLMLDIKPTKRYCQVSFVRGGATTVLGEIYIIQYKGDKLPETFTRTGYNGKILVEAAEGTA
jgi:hypothetical protein